MVVIPSPSGPIYMLPLPHDRHILPKTANVAIRVKASQSGLTKYDASFHWCPYLHIIP